ncbi:MAG: response regulator [Methyloprofundus sp.]|nr:response regulator [Methyloprofundus sp.]
MKSIDNKPNLNQQQINADKILIIHKNTPITLIGNLLGCIPPSIVLWNEQYATNITIWVCAVYLLTFIRWLHYRSLNPQNASLEKIVAQGKSYLLFILCAGCLWGSTSVLFFDIELEASTFLILTLITMISGSMTALSSQITAYASFAIPTMIPLILQMFLQGLAFYNWLGIGTSIYLLATFAFSRNMNHVINDFLVLKYANLNLVADLKKQTETANKANNDKSRFLAAASHDLRQPLHAVNLFIETLDNKISTEEQQYDLDRIRQGLDSLGELFNALLDISRLDSDTLPVNKIDFPIDELLQKLVEQFSLEAQAKRLKLSMRNGKQQVYSDPILLERLVRNLLSNAIRYTENGSIELFFSNELDGILQLHITDTGIGIPNKDKENIFSEFFQLHNPERDRNKGLGLGLAIVRRISRLLEHTIDLYSEPDKGTEFIIHLPIGKSKDQSINTQATTLSTNKLKNLEVLIIDNELDILEAMQTLLSAWECHVTIVESTEKALHLIADNNHPDFILADYRMPGNLNGCELVQLICQQAGYIPSLIITGDTGAEVFAEIKTANLLMLNKPIKPAQLRLAMTRLVKKSS